MPAEPVAAFALPLLISNRARRSPQRDDRSHTRTGAALNALCVKYAGDARCPRSAT